jgi:radical SAM superfamily enzyme YgiQ (UPF0313 family)
MNDFHATLSRMRRPRIVLFHPRVSRPEYHRLPWPILALAGNLPPDRFDVVLIDGGKEPDPIRMLTDAAATASLVGISCFTGNQTANALRAARALRSARPSLPIVWGGAHPSMYVKETLEDPCADVVVKGQGEAAFLATVEAIVSGSAPSRIPGVSYKAARGEPVYGESRKIEDQNQFGRPPFEALDVSRYLVHILVGSRAITYHSSTGCPFPCRFCTINIEFDFGWSAYSAERCVDELEALLRLAPGADAIEFADSNLIVSTKRTVALCEGMIARGVARPWIAFGRPDQLAKMPREVWKLMRDSGCRRFFVGVESGDPRVLEKIDKEHTTEQVLLMAERMREHGITPDLSFTLGYPEDPERDVRMSLELAVELKRIVPDAVLILNTYTPYESTPLFEDAKQNGLAPTASLSDWEKEEWRDFGFRKKVTPWMTPAIDRLIRDFETVAASAFFVEEDVYRFGAPPRARPLRDVMVSLARRRLATRRFERPLEVTLLRKLYFSMNPSLVDTGSSLVDGHRAGVK